ncbi:unnamed protein product [Closterium sp. NIES-64]|nr:unnamed protein product [Closterium sp. NIES-64]
MARASASPDLPPLARGAPVARHPPSSATEATSHRPLEADQRQAVDASPFPISAATADRSTATTAPEAATSSTNPAAEGGTVASQADDTRTTEDRSQLPVPQLPSRTSAAPWVLPPQIANAQAGGVVRAKGSAGDDGGKAGDAAAEAGKSVPMVPMVPIVPEMSASERWVRDALVAVRQYLTLPDGKKWPLVPSTPRAINLFPHSFAAPPSSLPHPSLHPSLSLLIFPLLSHPPSTRLLPHLCSASPRQPFEPNAKVAAASVLSVVGAALANAGGVGGGGLFVPLFNLLLGYDAKTSTALSKCTRPGGTYGGKGGPDMGHCFLLMNKGLLPLPSTSHILSPPHALPPSPFPPRLALPPFLSLPWSFGPSSPRPATCTAMIMGGAIASACFNAGLRHPTNNHRSLIDFSIARLMQPMLLLGISIGVMCNVVFPPWLITVMLCVLLSFMTYKTLGKGIATWRKESRVNPALSRTSSVSSHTSRRSTTPGYRGPHSAAAAGGGRAEQQYRSNRLGRGDASPFSPLPNGHSHSSTLYKPPHSHHHLHHHHEAASLKPTMSLDSAFATRSFAAAPPPSALLSHASLHSYTSLDSETALTVHDLVDPTSLPAPVQEEEGRGGAHAVGEKGQEGQHGGDSCGEGREGDAPGEGSADAAADSVEDGRAGGGCAGGGGDGNSGGGGGGDLRKPLLGRLRGTRADEDGESQAATPRSQCQAQAAPAAAVGGQWRGLMGGADAVAVAEMVVVWAFFLVVQVVKSSTPDCSTQYWLLTAAQVPVALFATLLTGWRARGRKLWWEPVDTSRAYLRLSAPSTPTAAHAARIPTHAATATGAAAAAGAAAALSVPGSPVPPGTPRNMQPRYDFARELTYPLASLLAGCMGGLLGIGGGMVMGPVLLELNIPPQVTSATSTFIVVFSSSLSVVEFYLLGRIPLKVASYFCLLAMIAAVSGLSIVRSIVIRSGKASIIIFALASVIGSSAIVLGAIGGLHVLNDWKHGESMGFRPLCNQVW